MSLIDRQLDKTINKVEVAIDRLKYFEPPDGYWLAYSGGKDSCCIKRLAEMAGVKFEAHYSCTSVDPPDLVRFIKADRTVSFDIPHYTDGSPITMWNLIVKNKMPPTRLARFCCRDLKESSGKGKVTVTGVRWAESVNRAKNQGLINIHGNKKSDRLILNLDNDVSRREVEQCYRTRKTLVNPIIDWLEEDVWEFIKTENVPYCGLYGDITKNYSCTGKKRLGCIGCPMNTKSKQEFVEYPQYKKLYIKAFDRMVLRLVGSDWKTGEEVFDWWVNGGKKYIDENQISFEDLAERQEKV